MQVLWFERWYLRRCIGALVPIADAHHDAAAGHRDHFAIFFCNHHLARVDGGMIFHTGRDLRNIRAKQRHSLSLHVRAHQSPVGVIMLQEGDQRGADAHNLVRGNIHVIDIGRAVRR